MALIIFQQALTMLLLMAVGYFLTKSGTIDDEFSKKLGKVLLDVIVPCLALNGFLAPPEGATLSDLWLALGLSAILLGISAIIGFVIYGRRKPIEDFSAAFMNVGFIGVPIVTAVFGPSAMFYVASTVCCLNAMQFTYGKWILTGDAKSISPKSIITNPVVVASVLGVLLFALDIKLPKVLSSGISIMSNANTAVAMIILGSNLSHLDWKTALHDLGAFIVIGIRLVAIPVVLIFVLKLLGLTMTPLVASIFVDVSCPVGANTAVMAQQFDLDYERAVKIVSLSTILSVISLPLVFQLANLVLGA